MTAAQPKDRSVKVGHEIINRYPTAIEYFDIDADSTTTLL